MTSKPLVNLSCHLMREIAEQLMIADDLNWPRETCPECQKNLCLENGVCVDCQVKGLSYVVGTALAEQYRTACITLRQVRQTIINMSEGTNDGQEEERVEDRAAGSPASS
jgi:hypothetical protein